MINSGCSVEWETAARKNFLRDLVNSTYKIDKLKCKASFEGGADRIVKSLGMNWLRNENIELNNFGIVTSHMIKKI